MQASRMFTLLVGLVGPLLSGCATPRPDVESQLAAEVARLDNVDRRLRTELWVEIQATNELLAKVIARLNEVDVQVQERRQAPPPVGAGRAGIRSAARHGAGSGAAAPTHASPRTAVGSLEARGHEPRPRGSSQPSAPLIHGARRPAGAQGWDVTDTGAHPAGPAHSGAGHPGCRVLVLRRGEVEGRLLRPDDREGARMARVVARLGWISVAPDATF